MSKRNILAMLVTLIASTSLCNAKCPSQRDINDQNITDLSKTGETTIAGTVYKLVGKDKTHNDYNGKILDTPKHLEGFLKITKFGSGAPRRPTGSIAGLVSVITPGDFCTYNISVGETSAVIVFATPDQKPTRPSTPLPSKPPVRALPELPQKY